MQFDSENAVVRLCVEGMGAEALGQMDKARALFAEAWALASDDFERFTAAHYVARQVASAEEGLHWNLEALRYAELVDGAGMEGYFPSLHLNVGKSYEAVGDLVGARKYYEKAAACAGALSAGPYSEMIQGGIQAALKRVGVGAEGLPELDALIEEWCEGRNLRALAFVLPVYVNGSGGDGDRDKLISALSYLSATRILDVGQQGRVDGLINGLAARAEANL